MCAITSNRKSDTHLIRERKYFWKLIHNSTFGIFLIFRPFCPNIQNLTNFPSFYTAEITFRSTEIASRNTETPVCSAEIVPYNSEIHICSIETAPYSSEI